MFQHADRQFRPASPRARLRRSAQALAAALLVGVAIVAASKAWAAGNDGAVVRAEVAGGTARTADAGHAA